jgi:hypothetical protein
MVRKSIDPQLAPELIYDRKNLPRIWPIKWPLAANSTPNITLDVIFLSARFTDVDIQSISDRKRSRWNRHEDSFRYDSI